MDLWLYSARIIGILSCFFLALIAWRTQGRVAILFALTCLAIASYFLVGASYQSVGEAFRFRWGGVNLVFSVIASLAAGLLLWLSRAMFAEAYRLPKIIAVLIALQIGLDLGFALDVQWGCRYQTNCDAALPPWASLWLLGVLPSAMKCCFALLANYWVCQYWRDDLVAGRRHFRIPFLLLLNVLAAGVVVAEGYALHFAIDHFPLISAVDTFLLSAVLMSLLAYGLLLPAGFAAVLTTPVTQALPKTDPDIHSAELAPLQVLMDEQKLYRDHQLSLAVLARHLALPEYRLRRLINQQLGYRNFRAFLNHYRLREACELLRSTDLPILSVALEVGFGSITTFNDVFKEQVGSTPTEYRSA